MKPGSNKPVSEKYHENCIQLERNYYRLMICLLCFLWTHKLDINCTGTTAYVRNAIVVHTKI
jgi:hypothetical protein